MKTIFEWDEIKARINFEKHKISFDEASTIFTDPFLLTFVDDIHSDQEERFISIGLSEKIEFYLLCIRNVKKKARPS